MCYRLFTPDGAYIRRISDKPFPEHYLKSHPEGLYTQDEVIGVTKAQFHKDNTSPIKQKRKDDSSPLEQFYQDADGDWKKIVKTPDYEFSYTAGVVGCAIQEQSENKIVATAADLEGTK